MDRLLYNFRNRPLIPPFVARSLPEFQFKLMVSPCVKERAPHKWGRVKVEIPDPVNGVDKNRPWKQTNILIHGIKEVCILIHTLHRGGRIIKLVCIYYNMH